MARKFLVVIQRHDCLSPWCILRNFLHEKKHWLQKGKLRVGVERKKKRLSVATGRHCHFMPNEKKYFDVIGQHHQSFETALRASSGRTAVIFVMYRVVLFKNCSHMPFYEDPEKYQKTIIEFLKKHTNALGEEINGATDKAIT